MLVGHGVAVLVVGDLGAMQAVLGAALQAGYLNLDVGWQSVV